MTASETVRQVKTYYGKPDRPVHVSLAVADGMPSSASTLCGRLIDAVTVIGLVSQITCRRCAKALNDNPEIGV